MREIPISKLTPDKALGQWLSGEAIERDKSIVRVIGKCRKLSVGAISTAIYMFMGIDRARCLRKGQQKGKWRGEAHARGDQVQWPKGDSCCRIYCS